MTTEHTTPPGPTVPRTAPLHSGRGDRWRARWLRLPLLGRVLIALAVTVGLANGMEAADHWWQYRPVVLAQEAAGNAQKPVTVLPMRIADLWTAGGSVSEDVVRARWTAGNAYFEPVYFALDHAPSSFRPGEQDRCYYFPIHDPVRADERRISHVGRVCFRGSDSSPYATGFSAVVR